MTDPKKLTPRQLWQLIINNNEKSKYMLEVRKEFKNRKQRVNY